MCLCASGRAGPGSGLSASGRAGPRAWVEDFGPGSGLEFRPVATSSTHTNVEKLGGQLPPQESAVAC